MGKFATQIFQSAMNRLHKKTGSIGTLCFKLLDDEKTTAEKQVDGALQTNITHTTPDAADVQKAICNQMVTKISLWKCLQLA